MKDTPTHSKDFSELYKPHEELSIFKKNGDYEERITFLLRELENHKVLIKKLEAELQKYGKNKEFAAEFQQILLKITEEKDNFENLYHKEESRNSELQMKISTLETETLNSSRLIKELKKNYELKSQETVNLLEKLGNLSDFEREKERSELKIKEQANKITILTQQVEEFSMQFQRTGFDKEKHREKEMFIEDLQRQITRFQSEIKDWRLRDSVWKTEEEKLKQMINELLERLSKIGENQQNYNRENDEKNKKIIELENKLALISSEFARVNDEHKRVKEMLENEREISQETSRKIGNEMNQQFERLLNEKDRKIEDLMRQITNFEENHDKYERNALEIRIKDDKIAENERKQAILQNELRDAMNKLQDKTRELAALTKKMQEKNQEIAHLKMEINQRERDIREVQDLMTNNSQELMQIRDRNQQLERNNPNILDLQRNLYSISSKNQELDKENQNLKELLSKLSKDNEDLQFRINNFNELEKNYNDLRRNLEKNDEKGKENIKNIEVYKDKVKILEGNLESLKYEIERLKNEKNQLLQEKASLEEKLRESEGNNMKFQNILGQTKETMDNMHDRIMNYEGIILEIPNLESQIERKTLEINHLSEELTKLRLLPAELKEMEHEILVLKEENQNFQFLLEKERLENEKILAEISEKWKKSEIKMKELGERFALIKKENEKLKEQIAEYLALLKDTEIDKTKEQDYMEKIEYSFNEIQGLNKIVNEKDQYIAELQENIENLTENNKNLHDSMEALQQKIAELEDEIALYENDRKRIGLEGNSQENRMKDFEFKHATLLKEIQSLNGLVLKRNEEIDTWRTKYTQLELSINEIRLKDTYLMDLEKKINGLENDNSALRKKMAEGSENIFKFDEGPFRNKIEELMGKVNKMNSEINELNTEISQKDKEIGIKNAELIHYKGENSKILFVQESSYQRDASTYKETIRNLEDLLEKERKEKEELWEKCNRIEKMIVEIPVKEERMMILEKRNEILLQEIEEWKKRHESFQRNIEQEIAKKEEVQTVQRMNYH